MTPDETVYVSLEGALDGRPGSASRGVLHAVGTAAAHTVVVDASQVAGAARRGVRVLDQHIHEWVALGVRVVVVASRPVASAVAAHGSDLLVRVTHVAAPGRA